MKKFISLSKYPGSTGTYFYTNFFKHYNIDATYTAIGTDNIVNSINAALEQQVSGISVSMPFKRQVLDLLDTSSFYVDAYGSCNTILVKDGKLHGHNTDIAGVEWALNEIHIDDTITILGSGSMADMFIKNLENTHFNSLNIAARSLNTWHHRYDPCTVLINCTALGTNSTNSPVTEFLPVGTRLVIDLAIPKNDLEQQCVAAGIKYMSGRQFYRQQFLKQFEIYTGIKPIGEVYDKFEYEKV